MSEVPSRPERSPQLRLPQELAAMRRSLVDEVLARSGLDGYAVEAAIGDSFLLYTPKEKTPNKEVGTPPIPAIILGSRTVSIGYIMPTIPGHPEIDFTTIGINLLAEPATDGGGVDVPAARSGAIIAGHDVPPSFLLYGDMQDDSGGNIGDITDFNTTVRKQPKSIQLLSNQDCQALTAALEAAKPYLDKDEFINRSRSKYDR